MNIPIRNKNQPPCSVMNDIACFITASFLQLLLTCRKKLIWMKLTSHGLLFVMFTNVVVFTIFCNDSLLKALSLQTSCLGGKWASYYCCYLFKPPFYLRDPNGLEQRATCETSELFGALNQSGCCINL